MKKIINLDNKFLVISKKLNYKYIFSNKIILINNKENYLFKS